MSNEAIPTANAQPIKYLPQLIATFKAFAAAYPDTSSIQAFPFQIAQVNWQLRKWDEATEWLNAIVASSDTNDGFYSDLAMRRLKKLEH